RSRTHGLKRFYKVGLSDRVESSAKAQSLEDQGRYNDKEMFDTWKKQNPRKSKNKDTQETQPSDPTYEALNEENVPTQYNDPPLLRVNTLKSGDDRLKLKELMEIYTKLQQRVFDLENIKTIQAQEISTLKKRVKRLEKKRRSRTHGLKRFYKVGLSDRVESSAKAQSLEDQGRYNDKEMFDTWVLDD
nr:hypothetical protein [Tanacetum cinerariifolium]